MLSVFPFSASYATKAATGGGKRGNAGRANAAADNKDKRKKETKLKRFGIYNFDPKATKKPNQYFETRPRFNLDGQMGDVANVGWLDIPKTVKPENLNQAARRYFASTANEPKIIARSAKINKRTGELKIKALGPSIGSVGGNIGQAAARAVGIVLDPSGRMRCPPGVPAANQFTDEVGSNCFDFTPAIGRAVMDIVKKAGQRILDDIRAVDSALPLVSNGSGGVSRAPKATMDRVSRGLASSTGRVVGTILGPDGRAIPSPEFERDVAELTATAIPIDPADYESVFDTLIRAAYPEKTEAEIRRLVKTAVQRQTMRDKTKSDIQDFLDLADELGVVFDKDDWASVQDAIAQIIGILQSPEGGGWGVDLSEFYGANPGDRDFAEKMLRHRTIQLKLVTDYLFTDPQKFGITREQLMSLGNPRELEEKIIEVMSGKKELSDVFPPGSLGESVLLGVLKKFEGLQQQEAGMFIGLINQRKKYPNLTSKIGAIVYIDPNDKENRTSDAVTFANRDGGFDIGIQSMRVLLNNETAGSNADGFTLFEPDGGMGTEVAKLTAISTSLDREGARRIRDEYLASVTNLADLQDAIDSGNDFVQRYVERSQGPIGQSIHIMNHEMIHGRQLVLIHNYLKSIPGLADQYTNQELMELTQGLLSGAQTLPSVFGRDWDYASIISNSDWLPGALDDLPEVMQVLIGANAGGQYAMEHYYKAVFLAPFVNGDPGSISELYLPLSQLHAQLNEMIEAGEGNSTKFKAALNVFNRISEVYNSGDDEKFAEAKAQFRIESALVFAEMQAEVAAGVESGFIKRTPAIDAFLGPLNVDTDITTDFGKTNPDAKPVISLTKDSIKQGIKDSIARQKRRRKNRKIIETDGLLPDDLYITEAGLSSMSGPDSDTFFDGISAFPSRVDVSQMGSTVHNHIMDSATSQQKLILDGNWREAKWNTSDPVDWSRALQSNPDSVVNSIENQLIPFIDLVDSSEMPTNVVVEVHMPPNYISEVTGTTIAIDKHHTGIMRSTDDLMDDFREIVERQAEKDRIEKERMKRRNGIIDYDPKLPLPYRGELRYGQNYDETQRLIESRARYGTSWELPSTPQRLMVTVAEGQIGLPDNTPGTNRGEIGALILPPGEIEIIGKTTNGVPIAKIVSQKRADEQLRGLKQILHSIGENETRSLGQRIVAKRSENRIDRHSELTRARVAKPAVLMELDSKRSTIANKIEYDPQTRTLTVSYRNGQKREFQNVPYGRLRDAGTTDKPDKLIRELESGPDRYTPRKGSVRNRGLSSSTLSDSALIREALDAMPEDDDAYDEKWETYLASLNIEPAQPRRTVGAATVEEAVMALLDGHEVDMPDIAGAHTLLEDLGAIVTTLKAMVDAGEIDKDTLNTFVFDLCQITVQGTSAFCLGNKGIPRFLMPQAEGKPAPGSAAERALEKMNAERAVRRAEIEASDLSPDEKKEALSKQQPKDEYDATEEFLAYLLEHGAIKAGEPGPVRSDKLKATQRDMQGQVVVGMLNSRKAGTYDPSKKPIFISRDNYVIDGHHRWAATLGMDFEDGELGNDHMMNVIVLDAPISQIIRLANEFTEKFGILKKPVAKRADTGEGHHSAIVEQVKRRAGLASSTSGSSVSKFDTNIEEHNTAIQQATERVANLEKALDVLERTGEWRGEEFGVTKDTHENAGWKLDEFDEGTPTNLTAEEVKADPDFVSKVRAKLEFAKDEQRLREHMLKAKMIRREQNTIDMEDLTKQEINEFYAIGKGIQDAEQARGSHDLDAAVVHAGQSELIGGVIDPGKTVIDVDSAKYNIDSIQGNTGKLNAGQLEKRKEEIKDAESRRDLYMSLIDAIESGQASFKVNLTREQRDDINGLLGLNLEYNDTLDLSGKSPENLEWFLKKLKGEYETEWSKRGSTGVPEVERVLAELNRQQLLLDESPNGFTSASRAGEGFDRGGGGGYFGRRAILDVPDEIADKKKFSPTFRGEARARQGKEKIFERWSRTFRGTAYLITDKEKIVNTLGPAGEKQVLGKVKPLFGVSGPIGKGQRGPIENNPRINEDMPADWDVVALGLMATAARLEKEGKEVTIENILATARPAVSTSTNRDGGMASRTSGGTELRTPAAVRTADILARAKEKGIDIDYWEREEMPKRNNSSGMTGNEALNRDVGAREKYVDKLKQAVAEARAQGDDEKADIINKLYREVQNMTAEELDLAVEDALKRLPPQFGQNVSVQVSDPLAIIRSGRYLTVHDVEERKQRGIRGLSERANFHIDTVIRSRSNTEAQFLNIDSSDISEDTRKLRPASGFVTSRMSEERRSKKLTEKYGPGVEIQHPYAVGEAATKDNADMTGGSVPTYGTSRIILKPEVAERSLLFRGDSISDTGTGSPALKLSTADDSPNRGQWFNPVSILYADRTGDMDSAASPGNNLPRDGGGGRLYQEAMILGSVETPDIAAIVVSPSDIRESYGKNAEIGVNTKSSWNVTSIIRTAEKRDELNEKEIDVVLDSPIFPLDEVEPFNATMTKQWVQEQIDKGNWKGVTFDEIVPDESTTPYEAWLRYTNKTQGVGSTDGGFLMFDHPDNEPGNDEKNKVNLSNMINEELKRIESVKSKKKNSAQRSGGLSSQTSSGDEMQKRLQQALKELEEKIEESKKPRDNTRMGFDPKKAEEMTKKLQDAAKEIEEQIKESKKPRDNTRMGRSLDEVAKIEARDLKVDDDPTVRPGVTKLEQKSWDGKDIYQTEDAGDALALIAAGHYVEMTHKEGMWMALIEFEAKWKEVSKGLADGDKLKTLNACLFMKTRNGVTDNMFCRNHHDIARLNMPQVSGFVGDEEATIMRAWVSGLLSKRGGAWDAYLGDHKIDGVDRSTITKERWKELHGKWLSKTETPEERAEFLANTHLPAVEPDAIDEFKQFLRDKGIPVSEGERVDVDTLHSTQNELVMDKISGIANKMLQGYRKFQAEKKKILDSDLSQEEKDAAIKKALDEFKSMPQMLPIVVSRDGYIFDGHHRAFGRHIFEGQLTAEELKEVKEIGFAINRADASISELLVVGKVYQDHMDIPAASGTGESNLWKDNPATSLNTVDGIDQSTWDKHKEFIFDNVDEKIDELDPTEYWKPKSPAVGTGTQSNEPKRIPSKEPARSGGLASRTTAEKVDQGPSVLTHGRMPDGTPVVADIETLRSRFGSTKKDVQNYFEKTHGIKISIPNGIFKEDTAGDQQGLVYGSAESEQRIMYGALQALDDVLNNLDAQQLMGRDALTISFENFSFSDTPQGLFGPNQKWWSRTRLGQNKTTGVIAINLHQLAKYDQSSPRAVSEDGLQRIWKEVITPNKESDNITSVFAQLGIPDGFELNYPGEDSPDLPEWERVAAVVQQRLAYAVMVHELGHYIDFSQREDSDASLEPAMMGLARFLTTGKKPSKADLDGIEEQIWSSSTPVASPAFTDAPSPSVYGLLNNQEKLAEGFLAWFTLMGSTRSTMTVDGALNEDYTRENVRASESADFRKAVSDIVTPLLDKLGPRVKSAKQFSGASRTSETTKLPPAALLFAILPLVDMLKTQNPTSAKMGRRYKRRITASDQKSAERNQESKEMCCS